MIKEEEVGETFQTGRRLVFQKFLELRTRDRTRKYAEKKNIIGGLTDGRMTNEASASNSTSGIKGKGLQAPSR